MTGSQDPQKMIMEAIARDDLRLDVEHMLTVGGIESLRRAISLGLVIQDGPQSQSAVDDFLLRRNDPVTRILTVVKFFDHKVEVGVASDNPETRHYHQQGSH